MQRIFYLFVCVRCSYNYTILYRKPSMFMNVPSVFVFSNNLKHLIRINDPANENKAIKGCSHKHNNVPQLSSSLQTPSNAIIEQATNNVPYTAESIEDNICLQKRMELLKRMWLQERTGPRLENILLNLFAFIIRVDYVKL